MITRLTFVERHSLDEMSIDLIRRELTGIYFICLTGDGVPYPFGNSKLIYIGMSESSQHSISRRLRGHLTGQSGNIGIKNFARKQSVWFTYLSLDVLSVLGTRDVRELETFFLSDFAREYGCYPLCNGQAGMSYPASPLPGAGIVIAWEAFD